MDILRDHQKTDKNNDKILMLQENISPEKQTITTVHSADHMTMQTHKLNKRLDS